MKGKNMLSIYDTRHVGGGGLRGSDGLPLERNY